jgi:UDP-N-acetylmuramate--alanine ligase
LLAGRIRKERLLSFSLEDDTADLFATRIKPENDGVVFTLHEARSGARIGVKLRVPGRHNAQNALAALAAAHAAGVPLGEAAAALESFAGLRRRFEIVGEAHGITVIDDFAHNPDKIGATLATAHENPGRLLLLFQPHGYGPLRLMKDQLIEAFAKGMHVDDMLFMPDPVYFGGTTDRSVTSEDIVKGAVACGRIARAIADRADCGAALVAEARRGDRIIIMGARDDTLSTFAADLLRGVEIHN